jgi:hypothetical protein
LPIVFIAKLFRLGIGEMRMQRSSDSAAGHRNSVGAHLGCAITLLAALVSASPQGWAQSTDRPLALPTRDVTVTYVVTGSDRLEGAQKLQVTYADGGQRTRVDYFRWPEAKSPFDAVIFDRPANHILAVMLERHDYVEREIGKLDNPGMFIKPDMRLTRQGQAVVAGLPCTDWTVRLPDKDTDAGTICVTDDGVTLRMTGGKPSEASLTATLVTYATPAAGVFEPPAGYQRRVAR